MKHDYGKCGPKNNGRFLIVRKSKIHIGFNHRPMQKNERLRFLKINNL